VASVSRLRVLSLGGAWKSTPAICSACRKLLGRPHLTDGCVRRVIEANMVADAVPCTCLRTAVLRHARPLARPLARQISRPHELERGGRRPVVRLLLVDAEGHDKDVLDAYPFAQVETWRVQFESNKINATRLAAVRARLGAHGFRPLQLGDRTAQPDDVWHHPESREEGGGVLRSRTVF